MADERPVRSSGAFFGRRHGKAIRPQQANALAELLPRYRIDLSAPPPAPLTKLFAGRVEDVRIEIGFGGGEHLLHRARNEPLSGFIGIEPFVNGMARVMRALQSETFENLRVYDDDATHVLDWLPDGSIAGIDLFYPDPWPKKRHWKRRFVSDANLDRFARVLKPGALFRFASDIDSYIDWTLLHCRRNAAFEWTAGTADDWRKPYPGWPGTRYEAKALREGRRPAYLTFVRK